MGLRPSVETYPQFARVTFAHARTVQSFGAWVAALLHLGRDRRSAAGAALVLLLGHPRLPALLCGAPRKAQWALSMLAATLVQRAVYALDAGPSSR